MDMATLQAMIKTAQLQGQSPFGANPQGAAISNPMMAAQFARQRANLTQPTSVMDERYPAWKKSQDDADKFMLLSDVIGAAVPLAGPAARMGVAGVKSMAPQAANMAEGYMARTGMLQPITAYHGSPHKFDAFDASKIGTGEGAQAYGHGLYLAENPQTAQMYADKLDKGSAWQEAYKVGGKEISAGDPQWNLAQQISSKGRDALISAQEKSLADALQKLGPDHPIVKAKAVVLGKIQAFPEVEKLGYVTPPQKNFYSVDLPDAHIAKMLDWDKPLSQQSWYRPVADVVKEYKGAGKDVDAYARLISKANARGSEVTGGQLYEGMLSHFGGSQAKVSEFMREAGIPGIKYLDGGSRGAGDGTRNFVVFPGEEKALKILERK